MTQAWRHETLVKIASKDGYIEVDERFGLTFNVTRRTGEIPEAEVGIMNLSRSTRDRITDSVDYVEIISGYPDHYGVIFRGTLSKDGVVTTYTEGDFLQQIYLLAADNTTLAAQNVYYPAGMSVYQAMSDLAGSLDYPIDVFEGSKTAKLDKGYQNNRSPREILKNLAAMIDCYAVFNDRSISILTTKPRQVSTIGIAKWSTKGRSLFTFQRQYDEKDGEYFEASGRLVPDASIGSVILIEHFDRISNNVQRIFGQILELTHEGGRNAVLTTTVKVRRA